MNAEIRTIEPMKVLFVQRKGNYMKSAEAAWNVLGKFANAHQLLNERTKAIGISHDDPRTTPEEQLRYDACITFEGSVQPEGEVKSQTIDGGKYAVFTHKGSYEGLDQVYGDIFKKWLPISGKKLRNIPMFELYVICEMTEKDPTKWVTEIFVPIED